MAAIWAIAVIGAMMMPGTQIAIDHNHAWMIAEVIEYNESQRFVTIKLSEAMVDGTDYNCQAAARLFHEICKQGYTLSVKPAIIGGWVPSAVNPMTVKWTRVLVGEAPLEEKVSEKDYKPRKRGRSKGVKPAGSTKRYEVNGKDVYIRKND